MDKLTRSTLRVSMQALGILSVMFFAMAFACGDKSKKTSTTNNQSAEGSMNCDDSKAPASGAITAALALKYLNCQMEGVNSTTLSLVENVKVEVGRGVPYDRNLRVFYEADVNLPVYPIRGSFLRYLCRDPVTEYDGPPGTNCRSQYHPKATGYCWKTTFGDWKCQMGDQSGSLEKENNHDAVVPPKSDHPNKWGTRDPRR